MTESLNDISYSLRRYYVDKFFEENIKIFDKNRKIIDLGGKKEKKRGDFNIDEFLPDVKYANISEETKPDYLCDITNLPIDDNTFDGCILSEVLEHVPDPGAVLREAHRILKPGAAALICTPFNFHVHADPHDYGRYTEYWYKENLSDIGFTDIKIEKQGLFFSVMANMLKLWAYEWQKTDKPSSPVLRAMFRKFVFWFQKKALQWEKDKYYRENWMFSGYTTGYGIVCSKK